MGYNKKMNKSEKWNLKNSFDRSMGAKHPPSYPNEMVVKLCSSKKYSDLTKNIFLKKKINVCEIGCLSGNNLRFFLDKKWNTHGIEINQKLIQLTKNNNGILIIIDDDGPGILESEYKNVFKPFYKIDKSRGESKSSVGLGLSIASDIIKSHGGNILLGKSHLGGLKVKIFLPL